MLDMIYYTTVGFLATASMLFGILLLILFLTWFYEFLLRQNFRRLSRSTYRSVSILVRWFMMSIVVIIILSGFYGIGRHLLT